MHVTRIAQSATQSKVIMIKMCTNLSCERPFMKNTITEMLDSITNYEADNFTNEGLIFSGFSIPKDISKRNECFKGWSQSFSMEKASKNTQDLNQFTEILASINAKILIDIYLDTFSVKSANKHSIENLIKLNLIVSSNESFQLTDKGICFLTTFLSLKNIYNS